MFGGAFLELSTKPKEFENRNYILKLYQQLAIPSFETSTSWEGEVSGRKKKTLLKTASRHKAWLLFQRAKIVALFFFFFFLDSGFKLQGLAEELDKELIISEYT